MPNRIPGLCRHRTSGRYFVRLAGKQIYLGSVRKLAKVEYERVLAEYLANGRRLPAAHGGPCDLSVAELIDRYLTHADAYYRRPDGTLTKEISACETAFRPLLRLYAETPAREFSPLALQAIQKSMAESGLARVSINKLIERIRRAFRWGVGNELVPPETLQRLTAVPGLRRGRCEARESEPIMPIDDSIVEATIACLPAVVGDMVRLQRLTGMRPDEVCQLRPCDVDRSGEIWVYRPIQHKTLHHGRERLIFVGPRGQQILAGYLLRPADAFCFSPAESERQRLAEKHERRVTPLSCGNVPGSNRRRKAACCPGERYDRDSYRRAIYRAADAADKLAKKKAAAAGSPVPADVRLIERWAPNRLRHSCATQIRREFDLESVQVVLGHSHARVSEIYAERDQGRAAEVARRIG